MKLRSNYIVSERDTTIHEYRVRRDAPIQEYRVRTWHSDLIIPLIWNLLSPLKLFHQAFFIEGTTSIKLIQEYKLCDPRILDLYLNTQSSHTTTQLVPDIVGKLIVWPLQRRRVFAILSSEEWVMPFESWDMD